MKMLFASIAIIFHTSEPEQVYLSLLEYLINV